MILSETQHRYFTIIRNFITSKGHAPTMQQIADIAGVSSLATVHQHIHRLIDYGYLAQDPKSKRLSVVPNHIQGLSTCSRGHEPIWYLGRQCPLCEVLARLPKAS
jgi:SOS-response transcriptional repressor LexA